MLAEAAALQRGYALIAHYCKMSIAKGLLDALIIVSM